MAQNWTTRDYYDPFPGLQAGMQMRAQREGERANRVAESQRLEDQQMRQADLLARMGVDPVMAPEGGIDWKATSKAANDRAQMVKNAESAGALRGWSMDQSPPTEEEAALAKTPEYQRAYRAATMQRTIKEAEEAARLEQIRTRYEGMVDVAEERGKNVSKPSATVTRDLPGGGTVRIPVTPEEAIRMTDTPKNTGADKWDQAIETITRFRDAGQPIDIELDDAGFPKITKSKLWHSASPSNKGSYDAAIQQILRRKGRAASPQGAGAKVQVDGY